MAAIAAHPQDKPHIGLVENTDSNFYLDELVDSILEGDSIISIQLSSVTRKISESE